MTAVVLAWFAPGCSTQDAVPELEYQTTFHQRTRGVVLHEDGAEGHAGMAGTNCPFDTSNGNVTGDYDLPGSGESVEDGGDSPLGSNSTLLTLGQNAYVIQRDVDRWWYRERELAIPGLQAARLWEDGVVARVRDDRGCAVAWYDFDGEPVARDRVAHCAAFDAVGDVAVVSSASGTEIVTTGGTFPADASGDLVVFDRVLDYAYVASTGGSEVIAVDARGGDVVWTATVPGEIASLSDAGQRAMAVVGITEAGGRGSVVFLDGRSGDEVAVVETPSAAPAMTVSGNGTLLALVRDEATYLYRLQMKRF